MNLKDYTWAVQFTNAAGDSMLWPCQKKQLPTGEIKELGATLTTESLDPAILKSLGISANEAGNYILVGWKITREVTKKSWSNYFFIKML